MTSPVEPRAAYRERIADIDRHLAARERRHLMLSNLRLAVFALGGVVAWLAFVPAVASPAWLVVPLIAFAVLMVVHARVLNAIDHLRRARAYFERGLSRLDGTWQGRGPDGARFAQGHAYAADLDLFGPGSLFQLLDTAGTEAGEETLAGWLKFPAAPGEVRARQESVAELRGTLAFREALAVHAADAHVSRTSPMTAWARREPVGLGLPQAALFAGCAGVTTLLVAATWAEAVSGWWLTGWLVVAAGVAASHRRRVWQAIRGVDAAANDLALLETLFGVLEQSAFTTERLSALRRRLDGGDRPSALIARLRRAIAARDALRNEFVRPFGLLLFVRSLAAVAIDRWHQQHRADLLAWIDAVGEIEALASLATHAFEHPADAVPVLVDEGPVFAARGLAHPLLDEHGSVRNDVALGGAGPRTLLVSGSNMSGKSTLLRAVGANTVLALAGGVVRCASLQVSPLAIGASIRVEDSLQQGHSRFYTEILRIRDVVRLAEGPTPVLFLLDEILHGTNSHDRRIGAEAVVRALGAAGAIGLVTTHDLALTALTSSIPGGARNVHFEDQLVDGQMQFDYRMRDGVVTHSNAVALMRAVGIRVPDEA